MNLGELLRSFFGLPRRHSADFDNGGENRGFFNDSHWETDRFGWVHVDEDEVFPNFTFEDNESFKDFQSAFSHLEDLMNGFHQSFAHFRGFPMSPGANQGSGLEVPGGQGTTGSIRDRMLKSPESEESEPNKGWAPSLPQWQVPSHEWPFPGDYATRGSSSDKVDQDLDTELEHRGARLSDVLPWYAAEVPSHDNPAAAARAAASAAFRFSSVRTIRKPDGSVETRRITRGSDGTEEEVVSRVGPKEEHVTTRREDARGNALTKQSTGQPASAPPARTLFQPPEQQQKGSLLERLREYFRSD